MISQNLHSLFNRRICRNKTDGDVQFLNCFNRGFCNCDIGTEPGGNRDRFYLFALFTINHAGMAYHRGFNDRWSKFGDRKIT